MEGVPQAAGNNVEKEKEQENLGSSAAEVLEKIGFPTDFESLKAMSEGSGEELDAMGSQLRKAAEALAFDEDGNVRNEKREDVEALADRIQAIEELFQATAHSTKAEEAFASMRSI